jgi:cobalamin biosynthesis protein CbiG
MEFEKVLDEVVEELKSPKETVLRDSLRALLEKKLRQTRSEILVIRGKYGISSLEEMEEKYREGTLEEEGTWQDYQRLDHLEHNENELTKLLVQLE